MLVLRSAFVALWVMLSADASACMCFPKYRSARIESIESHSCVFIGRMIETRGDVHTILVVDRFKGRVPDTVFYEPTTSCSYYFSVAPLPALGEWLIYCDTIDPDGFASIRLCSGTHGLMPETIEPMLAGVDADDGDELKRRYDAQQSELDLLTLWRERATLAEQMADMAEKLGAAKGTRDEPGNESWKNWALGVTSTLALTLICVILFRRDRH